LKYTEYDFFVCKGHAGVDYYGLPVPVTDGTAGQKPAIGQRIFI
jgi:hypothetical protein